jgi:hypothetical protein
MVHHRFKIILTVMIINTLTSGLCDQKAVYVYLRKHHGHHGEIQKNISTPPLKNPASVCSILAKTGEAEARIRRCAGKPRCFEITYGAVP